MEELHLQSKRSDQRMPICSTGDDLPVGVKTMSGKESRILEVARMVSAPNQRQPAYLHQG